MLTTAPYDQAVVGNAAVLGLSLLLLGGGSALAKQQPPRYG
jgi:hypothetical protein